MSTFIVYKSKRWSLKKTGNINKFLYGLLFFFLIIANWAPKYLSEITSINSLYLSLTGVLLIVCLVIFARKINKTLEKLGEIKISKGGITKSILGFHQDYQFEDINEIKVENHIRSMFAASNQDQAETYLVTMKYTPNKKESFVVSSESIDKPEVNFFETIKNIEKFTGHKIKIKS
jgi:hypothetical protein